MKQRRRGASNSSNCKVMSTFLGVSTRTRPLLQRIWGLTKVRKVYLEEISVGTGYSCVIALPHHAGPVKATLASRVWPAD